MTPKAPKYETIKQFLIHGISSRTFTDAVPSENQLAERFGVSRMTARRALDELERDGAVERFPGKGTFIRKTPHYTRGFFRVQAVSQMGARHQCYPDDPGPGSKAHRSAQEYCRELQTNGQIVLLRILNLFNDKPVRYAVRYLVADSCAGILRENLSRNRSTTS